MAKLREIFDYKMFVFDILKLLGALPPLIDLRCKKIYINGEKTKDFFAGKYLISSNHTSYCDPVIISCAFWMRRVGFVATKELFATPFLDKLFHAFGCIPIDKENPSMETFKMVKDRLNRGHIVGVFPEGYVEKSEELGVFKSGIVMMAVMSGCDIVPIYIGKRRNRLKRQTVVIGEKIHLKDFFAGPFPGMNEVEKITAYLKEKENELEEKYLESYGGN